jgi:hypothetical protein
MGCVWADQQEGFAPPWVPRVVVVDKKQMFLEGVWKGDQGVLAAKRASIRRLMTVYIMAVLVSGRYS